MNSGKLPRAEHCLERLGENIGDDSQNNHCLEMNTVASNYRVNYEASSCQEEMKLSQCLIKHQDMMSGKWRYSSIHS
jgi:hypothetical protein